MKRTVTLSPDARRQLQRLRADQRATLREALETQLGKDDATVPTKNRFRLRRPSPYADYELRVGPLRVFYRVEEKMVRVVLIGKKRGDVLLIDGKRLTL
ncbi:MAG: type II toxin-antitoxin system RelE/ParE family toxin [Deltaproteobacteria bacterium]|nr:type II toxin-antitoxin system RelE/ParE family toxin [Deltaproteobacteria bacterium]